MFSGPQHDGSRFRRPDNCTFQTEARQFVHIHVPAGDAVLAIESLRYVAKLIEDRQRKRDRAEMDRILALPEADRAKATAASKRRNRDQVEDERQGIERRRDLAALLAAQWGGGR